MPNPNRDKDPPRQAAAQRGAQRRSSPVHARGRILFADDDTLVLRSTAAALSTAGFDVAEAISGADVLSRLGEHRPDALLLDIDMPGNRELELLHSLQTEAEHIPVVILTGHPSLDTAVDAVRLGVVDYVVKPADIDELVVSLDRAVQRGRVLKTLEHTGALAAQLSQNLQLLHEVIGHGAGDRPAGSGDPDDADAPLRNLTSDEVKKLSPREREVLVQLAQGNSPERVAKALRLSTNTIRNHMKGIYLKLGVNSQIALLGRLATARR